MSKQVVGFQISMIRTGSELLQAGSAPRRRSKSGLIEGSAPWRTLREGPDTGGHDSAMEALYIPLSRMLPKDQAEHKSFVDLYFLYTQVAK